MTKYLFLLVLYLCSAVFLPIMAQTHPVRHFTDKDGLPNNNVKAIHKDSRGTLWIATNAGLCTYNGKVFTPFDFKGHNKSNKVWAIEEDELGNLYFGTFGEGLIKYDGQEFTTFISNSSVPSNHIRNLKYSANHKCLYIGAEDGFSILKDTVLTHFTLLSHEGKIRERGMCFFEKGDTVFVHTFTGGTHYYLHSTDSIYLLSQEHPYYQYSSSQTAIDSNGNIFQGVFRNGLKVYKPDSTYEYKDLGQVFGIEEGKNGETWVAAWSYYNMSERGGFFRVKNDCLEWMNPQLGIDYKMAWCICYDAEQDVNWLGTDGDGIYLYMDNGITTYDASYFGLDELDCYDLKEIDDKLWITAGPNLIIGNEDLGFKRLSENDIISRSRDYQKLLGSNINDLVRRVSIVNALPNNLTKLYSIETKGEEVWIGSLHGYFIGDKDFDDLRYMPAHRVMCENFKFMNDTSIYGAGYGILRYINNYKEDIVFEWGDNESAPKDVNRIIQTDKDLWFSSWNRGLYHYRDGEYHNYSIGNPEMSLNHTDLCIDNHCNLIAGTNDGQVHIMKYEGDSINIKYKIKDEIKGNSVQWLLADSKDQLWIGTNLGLNVISLDTLYESERIYNRFYNDIEGFKERDIRTAIEDSKGNILIGGKDALIKIDPDKFLAQTSSNTVELTNILVNNQQFNWAQYDITTSRWSNIPEANFELPYDLNSFVFEFKANNQFNADKDCYSVRLEGFDKEFSDWNANNTATYTNLNPGDYRLIVRSKNLSSGQTGKPYEFAFRITPPWWNTWWFYVLSVVALVIGIWLFITVKIKRIKKKEEEKRSIDEQITSLKTQAIQAQMNPHFIFNAITSVQSFMLSNDNDAALDYLMLFANLIRKTLDLVSEKSISLQTELDYLDNYVKIESMRFIGGINYTLDIAEYVDTEDIIIPPLLLQPFVENAIKHGLAASKREKEFSIVVKSIEGLIQVDIQDNGIGYHQSIEMKKMNKIMHNSKGIIMAEERIKQMVGFDDRCGVHVKNLSNGTLVQITVPT